MVIYEVNLQPEPQLFEAITRYMRDRHIPQIFETGCFVDITFERCDEGRLRTCYRAADRAALDHYLAVHTAAMRADFIEHFPQGVTVSRAVWEELGQWRAGGR